MASTINASNSGFGGIVSTGDSSGQLQLQTANTTAVTIDTSQNVGIGTTSPSALLNVSNASAKIRIGLDASSQYLDIYRDSTLGGSIYNAAQASPYGYHVFQTAGTERMRIDSSGNVLIGTTTGDAHLRVDTNLNALTGVRLVDSGTTTGNYIIFTNSAGNNAGTINHNGTTTVAYNTSSDYRLKENIVPMTGALDKVAQLKPVTYTWKNTDNELGEGFIAHELAEVCPIAVTGLKDAVDENGKPIYQGVDTSFLVATLTAAIQEQQTIINDLKARVTALENK